jgi:hypothetical protein
MANVRIYAILSFARLCSDFIFLYLYEYIFFARKAFARREKEKNFAGAGLEGKHANFKPFSSRMKDERLKTNPPSVTGTQAKLKYHWRISITPPTPRPATISNAPQLPQHPYV